jgi:tRNA threonylcarbamoyladenosine biosynthesis protein TsaE
VPRTLVRTLRTRRDTRQLGADIAAKLVSGDLVILSGDLGAGKTFLARTILRGLGVDARITSPTFALVHEYDAAAGTSVLHADLYRLRDTAEPPDRARALATLEAEVARLGLRERRAEGAVVLVEWAEDAAGFLGGDPAFVVSLQTGADGARTATLSGQRAGGIV